VIPRLRLFLVLLHVAGFSQTPLAQARYQAKFENDIVAVYELDLSARESVSAFQAAHDTLWLSLSSASVTFVRQQGKADIQFEPGDARFFPSFDTKQLTNTGISEFRGMVIVLKPRALVSNGCECTGKTGRTVCGCKGAAHLESLWAFNLGEVTLAGTSLAAGEAFRAAAPRDDMLLVAITDVDLLDQARAESESELLQRAPMHLKPGDAAWVKGGRHQFRNVGAATARFVTFEF